MTGKPTFDKTRALSYSQISSFEWNKEQWYNRYILGMKQESPELQFGSYIDKLIQEDKKFLPKLPRYTMMQYKMNVILDGIPLVGLPDGLCLKKKLLADYKTGKNAWTQKRADETKQLTMYLLLIFITHKIPPGFFRCFIHWMPTEANGDFTISLKKPPHKHLRTFETKRTMNDILEYAKYIKKIYKEMQLYAQNHE